MALGDMFEVILAMRADELSYRAIGAKLGVHWTRVGSDYQGAVK